MRCARFYVCHHGVRLTKAQGQRVLNSIADIDHAHIDVLQVHRADVFTCENNEPLLVKLSGKEEDSLRGIYTYGIHLSDGKIDKYRIGYTYDFDYYCRHTSPSGMHDVTFAQVYNSAAKMVRPCDSGYVISFAICRGYAGEDKLMRKTAAESRQYIRNMLFYVENYVHARPQTRIEEVLTIDRLRYPRVSLKLAELGAFDDTTMRLTTLQLFRKGLMYQFHNWRIYLDTYIGPDLEVLRSLLSTENDEDRDLWISPARSSEQTSA